MVDVEDLEDLSADVAQPRPFGRVDYKSSCNCKAHEVICIKCGACGRRFEDGVLVKTRFPGLHEFLRWWQACLWRR